MILSAYTMTREAHPSTGIDKRLRWQSTENSQLN